MPEKAGKNDRLSPVPATGRGLTGEDSEAIVQAMVESKNKAIKTLAMRVLERNGIAYEPRYYEVEAHLPAEAVAAVIGMRPEKVFKTLVVLPETPGGKPILACIPADAQLDLKKLAAAAGEKRLQMASQRDAERLTGLQKGGISPLALLDKGFRIFIDETIILHDRIEISAGKVGAGVIVPVEELMRVLGAPTLDLCR
jgi:Cys-tRNA(Pro)/Cys-tRNA(Cys) deacylase